MITVAQWLESTGSQLVGRRFRRPSRNEFVVTKVFEDGIVAKCTHSVDWNLQVGDTKTFYSNDLVEPL